MKRLNFLNLIPEILRAPADEGAPSAAGVTPPADGAAGEPAAAPESVLFPSEGDDTAAAAGDDTVAAGDDTSSADGDDTTQSSEGDDTTSGAENADVVPEDGKYELTMPEGVEVDTALMEALGPDFKELGLTNGQAQKLVDKYIAHQQSALEAHAKTPEGQWSTAAHAYFTENGTPDKWAETAQADKEIGGSNWEATTRGARAAIDKLGTPELRNYLNASGAGNHPELIRLMAKVGGMISEDAPATGGTEGSGKPADAAHLLFPSDAPKG